MSTDTHISRKEPGGSPPFPSTPQRLLGDGLIHTYRELSGIRPDIAAIAMTSHSALHRYVERLLAAIGNPSLLIPTHHDDMTTPLTDAPSLLAAAAPTTAAKELDAASAPASRVLSPQHLRAVDVTAALA